MSVLPRALAARAEPSMHCMRPGSCCRQMENMREAVLACSNGSEATGTVAMSRLP